MLRTTLLLAALALALTGCQRPPPTPPLDPERVQVRITMQPDGHGGTRMQMTATPGNAHDPNQVETARLLVEEFVRRMRQPEAR